MELIWKQKAIWCLLQKCLSTGNKTKGKTDSLFRDQHSKQAQDDGISKTNYAGLCYNLVLSWRREEKQ
jgi:hypothetical protein